MNLDEISQRDAERTRNKIEKLIKVRSQGLQIPRDVAAWIEKLSDEVAGCLAELDLIESRFPKAVVPMDTVGDFMTDYLSRRDDQEMNAMLTFYVDTARDLIEFFGSDRRLDDITLSEANNFRRHLRNDEKLSAETVVCRCELAETIFEGAVSRKLIKTNPFENGGEEPMLNPCHRCETGNAVTGEKYCRKCRKAIVAEMKATGYLK